MIHQVTADWLSCNWNLVMFWESTDDHVLFSSFAQPVEETEVDEDVCKILCPLTERFNQAGA